MRNSLQSDCQIRYLNGNCSFKAKQLNGTKNSEIKLG